jgi:hypothetical protein
MMKKTMFRVAGLMSLFAAVTLTACNEENDPNGQTNASFSVDKTTIEAGAEGGNYTIVVTSDTAWTVASNEMWCTVAAAKDTVTVTVAENTALEPRTATITISAGALSKAITVMQAAGGKDDNANGLVAGQIEYRANAVNVGPFVIEAKTKRLYIDWGDGTKIEYPIPSSDSIKVEHTYTITTAKTIRIETEGLSSFYMYSEDDGREAIIKDNRLATLVSISDLDKYVSDIDKYYGFEEIYFGKCSDLQWLYLNMMFCVRTVDVSKLSNLQYLVLDDVNILETVDISQNTNLRYFGTDDVFISSLDVTHNVLLEGLWVEFLGTSLDVSKNTKLKQLACGGGELTSLDVSKNTELVYIKCRSNNISAEALNALFGSLPTRTASDNAEIVIGYNPGTDNCDRSIATGKGWTVGNDSSGKY